MICPRCRNSQSDDLTHCEVCGIRMPAPKTDAPAADAAPTAAPDAEPALEPGAFVARFYHVVNSPLFLVGVILLSVPSILRSIFDLWIRIVQYNFFSFFMNFTSSLTALLPLLPVVALGLIVFSVRAKKPPTSLRPGLMLLKLYAILQLVFLGIMDAVNTILVLGTPAREAIYVPILIRTILVQILYVLFVISLLRVLKTLRRGVLSGAMGPRNGLRFFTALGFVCVGLTTVQLLIPFVVYLVAPPTIDSLQSSFTWILFFNLVSAPSLGEAVWPLLYSSGLVCLLVPLQRFQTLLALPIACEPSDETL